MATLYTVEDLAGILRTSPRHVRALIKNRSIPAFDFDGCVRIREQSLLKVLPRFYIGSAFEKTSSMPIDWMKPCDVAEMFGLSTASILRRVRRRSIPFYRFGGHTIRFRGAELEAFIKGKELVHHG